jgi:hypothetical protein
MQKEKYLPNVRRLFKPDPGFTLIDIDLSGADAAVVAWEANDQELKDAFMSGMKRRGLYMERTMEQQLEQWQLLWDGEWLRLKLVNRNGFDFIQVFDNGKREWVSISKLSELLGTNLDIEFRISIDQMHFYPKDSLGFPNPPLESSAQKLEFDLTAKIQDVNCPHCGSRFSFKLTML